MAEQQNTTDAQLANPNATPPANPPPPSPLQTPPADTAPPRPVALPDATVTPSQTTRPPGGASSSAGQAQNDLLPSEDEAMLAAADVAANKVATATTVAAILAELRQANPSVGAADLFALAWACYHNGSSRYTTLSGASPHGMPLAEIKDRVENHCTLRQFCMYYAKICYNTGRATNRPPANWMAKGYKEESKFAAFDFFGGVLNDAAPRPAKGMKFTPTAAEIQAHAVNSTMTIIESREPAHQVSNRGNMLAMQQVRAPQQPPMITFD